MQSNLIVANPPFPILQKHISICTRKWCASAASAVNGGFFEVSVTASWADCRFS